MIKLKLYKQGEDASFIYCMAIIAEAAALGCPVLLIQKSMATEDDAENINAIITWLIFNCQETYSLLKRDILQVWN